jgi:hypothetical protein
MIDGPSAGHGGVTKPFAKAGIMKAERFSQAVRRMVWHGVVERRFVPPEAISATAEGIAKEGDLALPEPKT